MVNFTPPIVHPFLGKKLFVFDVDSTLRECTVEGQFVPNASSEWRVMANVKNTLNKYTWGPRDKLVGIISNQGGIAHGFVSELTTRSMLVDLLRELFWGSEILDHALDCLRYCPHRTDAGCYCRKPSPFMLLSVIEYYNNVAPLRLSEVLYIGDMDSDRECAERAQVDFCFAEYFFAEYAE